MCKTLYLYVHISMFVKIVFLRAHICICTAQADRMSSLRYPTPALNLPWTAASCENCKDKLNLLKMFDIMFQALEPLEVNRDTMSDKILEAMISDLIF